MFIAMEKPGKLREFFSYFVATLLNLTKRQKETDRIIKE